MRDYKQRDVYDVRLTIVKALAKMYSNAFIAQTLNTTLRTVVNYRKELRKLEELEHGISK